MKFSRLLLVLALAVGLASCGGGGKKNNNNNSCTNVAGTWETVEEVFNHGCDGTKYTETKTYLVAQNGCGITVTEGTNIFSGNVKGDKVNWSGSYQDKDGTVTIDQLELSFQVTNFTGEAKWTWEAEAGTNRCSGTTRIEGVRTIDESYPPNYPTNLTATATSSGSVELTWTDNSDNETGFVILRKQGGNSVSSGFDTIQTLDRDTSSFADTGLEPATTYSYIVRAVNAAGFQDSISIEITTLNSSGAPPEAPTGLTATAQSSSSIVLSWIDNSSNESEFRIYQATASTGPWTQIVTLAANETSFTVTDLNAATNRYFKITAYNDIGESGESNIVSAETQASPSSPPAAPGNLTATSSGSSITLTWNDNSSNETGFRIYQATASSGPWTQIATPAANTVSYTVIGLNASTTHYYKVVAYNSAGTSADSNVAQATTESGSVSIPTAPTNLTATAASSSSINLTWQDNSTDETGFRVYRATANTGPWTQIATPAANTVSHTAIGLSASTTYHFKVVAYNSAGNSADSNIGQATTLALPISPPAAPSNLIVSNLTNNSLTLSWSDNSTDEQGFRILSASSQSGTYSMVTEVAANSTSYTHTPLAPSTTYWYRVRAYNAGGESETTGPVSGTTDSESFTLSVIKSGGGTGTVTGSNIDCGTACTVEVASGTGVTLTATPDSGMVFSSWAGCTTVDGATCYIEVDSNITVMASFQPAMSTSLEIYDLPSTSSDGNYTVKWRNTGWLGYTNHILEESTDQSFSSAQPYYLYDGTMQKTFSGKPDGIYCYRVKGSGTSFYSAPECITIARPTTAIVRIVNNTKYPMIDIRLNSVQKLSYPYGIGVGKSYDFVLTPSGGSSTVNYTLGVGYYDAYNYPDPWFMSSGIATINAGQVTTITFNNPTITQILTGFSSSKDWIGDYWVNLTINHKKFRFFNNGTWALYDNNVQQDTGSIILVSWPDESLYVDFKLCPTCSTTRLYYPFNTFTYRNGPPSWQDIQYYSTSY